MHTPTTQQDRDDARQNERLKVRELALEILRQHSGPDILTMLAATQRARAEISRS